MANPLDMLKQVVSTGSTAGVLRDRAAANAAAANATDTGGVEAATPALPVGAALTQGIASPMELAVRAKLKAGQDAKLQRLLQQRGVPAVAPINAPVIGGNPADLIQ